VLALVAGGGIAWMFFNGRQPAPPPAAVPQPIASDSHPVTLDAPELQRVAPLPEPANLPTTTVNGETGIPLPTAADLAPGFAPYNHGDYPVAADKFRTLASTYSNSEMPFLYLGISELELGQNAPAQHDLDHAHKLATPDLLTEIDWYLAISDLRLGLQSEALALLQSLCAMNDNIHHARACAIAHQIDAPSH
jgi:tetratricopeptide (TPR) repeat protein